MQHLVNANTKLSDLNSLGGTVVYFRPSPFAVTTVRTFSDALFNISKNMSFCQSELLMAFAFDSNETFHSIDWSSCKRKRVFCSVYGAEISACSDDDNRGHYVGLVCMSIFPTLDVRHQAVVDSKRLFDTLTTLHKGEDYRLR